MKKRQVAGGILLALAAGMLLFFIQKTDIKETVPYRDFWSMAEAGAVQSVRIGAGNNWQITLQDGQQLQTPDPKAPDGKERLLSLGIDVTETGGALPAWAVAILAAGALFIVTRRQGKGALGLQSYAAVHADEHIPHVTFDDVAVSEDTLRSMRDLVTFLKMPEAFRRCGARMPKGVLLYGPPGNGKTLLAKALAGEANTAFFAVNGADFVQVYVGVGASRVREVFKKARKAGGGVIFIDEIDAIGKKRDNGNDEREQTLNALLTEMSGFSQDDNILVLAATNRIDTIDPALLREGRFDRRIEVGLPDVRERLKILHVHARNKPLSPAVSLDSLAHRTVMFSGAQLESLLNEAAIRAARRSGDEIDAQDVDAAFCAVTVGEDRPGLLSHQEKRIIAYHEAGHAVATHWMQPETQLVRLTVIPSSRGAAGYLMSLPKEHLLHTKKEMTAMLCAALGGRAAEEMIFGKDCVTTGAGSDFKRAREIAAAMAGEFAMGEGENEKQDAALFLREAQTMTRQCLHDHADQLERIAQALMDKETLGEADLAEIFQNTQEL